MKKRTISAILAALMLLTACTGCGAMEKSMETNDAVAPAKTAGAGAEIAGDAGDFDMPADIAAPEAAADGYDGGDDADDAYEAEGEDVAFDYAMADAVAAAGDAPMGEEGYIRDEPVPEEIAPEAPHRQPEVGMLTAGEWRDHHNWGFFANLVNNGTIRFPSFGIDPTQRIAVTVKNTEGTALPNARVTLLSGDGTGIWHSVTDKNGVAYVFEANGQTGSTITVTTPDGLTGEAVPEAAPTNEQGGAKLVSDRSTEIVVEAAPVLYPDTQIMFIVDTTGSMGDEMLFLQSDFSAIVDEVGDEHTSYAVSFYKDEGDSYVTRTAGGFTNDVQAIRSQLNAESADGGGDEPEAVAEALSEAFHLDAWADDSVKIAFLIYDAPPHTGKEAVLQDAIAAASEKGIHLVPVVSSNSARETELFGRAAAICTNGSYVFLTDHSGIGGSHLEPIIGDYEVEKLHDIIVRIINDYKQ